MPSLRKLFLSFLFLIFLIPATAAARGYYRGYRGHSRGFYGYGSSYRSWYPRSYFYGGFSYYNLWPRSYYRPYYYYYSPPVVVIERQRHVVRERDYDRDYERPAHGRDAYGRRY